MSEAIAVCHGEFGRVGLYRLDRNLVVHAHREAHVILLLAGDTVRMRVSGVERELTLDQGMAIGPWLPHDLRLIGAPGLRNLLVLYLTPSWLEQRTGRSAVGVNALLRMDTDSRGAIRALLDRVREAEPARQGNAHAADGVVPGIERLIGSLSPDQEVSSAQTTPWQAVADRRIRTCIRLLGERLDQPVNIPRVAADAGLSRPHLYRLFREQLGMTPNLFVNTLRAERSIQLLVGTDDPIVSIGASLGFSSQASFTRFFRTNVGASPSEYRRVSSVSLSTA